MLESLIYLFVRALVLDPLQTELTDRLAKARVPTAIIAQVKSCTTAALPVVVRRVQDDPRWAVGIAVDLWLKRRSPEQVADDAAPACRPAVDAARSYLDGRV
ncbi:hypothetical protein E0H22_15600 [Rhodopseudomonas boonkerdii]|uniref:hypothetical protein n=1 Tax=Rhodopseudomonas boonkerdii TaxID=475937 RepID=UPI001E2A5434|nr:hypothetical protein [Rhodopseudomonas boonkerdii]UGV26987.1 hypothetical protein E0H22_15600 [Rhodopseudomonas boonkerdii]